MAWWHPSIQQVSPRFSPTVTVLLGLEEAAVGLSLRLFRQVQLGARLVQLLLGRCNKSHDGHDGHVTRMINSGWSAVSLDKPPCIRIVLDPSQQAHHVSTVGLQALPGTRD